MKFSKDIFQIREVESINIHTLALTRIIYGTRRQKDQ